MDTSAWLSIALAFFIVAASPGPATISNSVLAMDRGWSASFPYALGLTLGIAVWGVVAATGLGAVLQASVHVLSVLKVFGGLYLLWLAWQSARSAMAPDRPAVAAPGSGSASGGYFLRGLALNLSNPKTVIAWMAALSVGLDPGATPGILAMGVGLCIAVALFVNVGYTALFSLPGMMAGYRRVRRMVDGVVAGLFAVAGIGLIRSAFVRGD